MHNQLLPTGPESPKPQRAAMYLPHQSTAFFAVWTTLPLATLAGVALEAREDLTRRRWPEKSDVLRGAIKGVLFWMPAYGVAALLHWALAWRWLSIPAFYLFHAGCLVVVATCVNDLCTFTQPLGRLWTVLRNVIRPKGNKLAFRASSAGQITPYFINEENRQRQEQLHAINLQAVSGVTSDSELVKIAQGTDSPEIAEAALRRLSDKNRGLECPKALARSPKLVLELLGRRKMETAIAGTDDPVWLDWLLRHCSSAGHTDAVLAKLGGRADLPAITKNGEYPSPVRRETLRRCLDKVSLEDLDENFVRQLPEDLFVALAKRCASQEHLHNLARHALSIERLLSILHLINNSDFVLDQALAYGNRLYAGKILVLVDDANLQRRKADILNTLPFSVVRDLLGRLRTCPACGGQLEVFTESYTHMAGGPTDSFFRESVSYEATTTCDCIRCVGCGRKFASESSTS